MILLAPLVSCTGELTRQPPAGGEGSGPAQETARGEGLKAYPAASAAGVVVLGDRHRKGDFVHIYNEDGSLWYKFSFYDEAVPRQQNDDFKPFSFHPDYFVLALRCVGKGGGRLEVVVNEETGLKKYVREDDTSLKFRAWEEHILQVFAVDFNPEDNPVLEKPGGNAKSIDFSKRLTFHPAEVDGDWLKVRWSSTGQAKGTGESDHSGWVRWKKDGVIAIELIYFS